MPRHPGYESRNQCLEALTTTVYTGLTAVTVSHEVGRDWADRCPGCYSVINLIGTSERVKCEPRKGPLTQMVKPSRNRQRFTSPLGVRVLVCGQKIALKPDLICLLPATLDHSTHTSLAVQQDNQDESEDNKNYLVLVYRKEGETEVTWQSVSDPEG